MFNLMPSSQAVTQETEVYIFRDTATGLYIGYDGYDTTFAKGISPCVKESELLQALNVKLISATSDEMFEMLRDPSDKRWAKYGGHDKLEIIRLDLMIDGYAFSPGDLAHIITIEQLERELADGEL